MADIIDLPVITKLDINPNKVVEGLSGTEFSHILVLGWDSDDEFFIASNTGKKGENLLLIEEFKLRLIRGDYD